MKNNLKFILVIASIGLLGIGCKKELVKPVPKDVRPSAIKLSGTDGWTIVKDRLDRKTTIHGQQRIAGPNATRGRVLSEEERYDTKYKAKYDGKVFKQKNGPMVYLDKQQSGKYNGIVEGDRGLITTMKGWKPLELAKMGNNQQWPDDIINDLRQE